MDPAGEPDRRRRVLQIGPRTGERGGGGMSAVVAMMLEDEGRPFAMCHLPSARLSRRLHSADLWVVAGLRLALSGVRDRPAVVHVHLADGGSLRREGSLLRLARRLGIPTVATVHASELPAILADDRDQFVRVLAAADIVHALGPTQAAALAPCVRDPTRIVVIPNAVALGPEPDGAGTQPPVVVFGGEFGTRKGADVLLAAWPAVRASVPDAQLVLMGPSRDLEPPAETDGIVWRGPVPRSDLTAALAGCRLAVLPSRREALPMFLLEAMAMARPVVATAVGDVATLVPRSQLVPVDDPRALADAMVSFLSDEALATRAGADAREAIRASFATPEIHGRLDAVYEMLARTAPQDRTGA